MPAAWYGVLSKEFAEKAVEAHFLCKYLLKVVNVDALLLRRVAVAQGDGVVFESLMIDGDAIRCADCILTTIAFADGVFLIHLTGEVEA